MPREDRDKIKNERCWQVGKKGGGGGVDAYNTGGFKGEGFSMATLTLYNREKPCRERGEKVRN